MKLLLKRIGHGLNIALCGEDDSPLPNQQSVVIKSVPDDVMTATVTFIIGGDVRLACDDRDSNSLQSGTEQNPP